MSIRVALVITGLGVGGAETRQYTVARHIDRDRYVIDFYCLYDEDNTLVSEFVRLGYVVRTVKVFDYSRHFARRVDLHSIGRLVSFLRAGHYDIVHCQLPHANTVGRLAGKIAGIPAVIGTVCNIEELGRVQRMWDCLLGRLSWRVMCISNAVMEHDLEAIRLPRSRYVVIHNGIDTSRFSREAVHSVAREALGVPEDAFVIGAVGRLHPYKDFPTLMRAYAAFREEVPKSVLLVVGEGEERETLSGLCRELRIERDVVFAGLRRDIPEVIACFDLFVLSSVREGFGNVVVEAMSMGVPVVVSDLGPLLEIVQDGQNGYVFPAGDVSALAKLLKARHADREGNRCVAENGRRTVEAQFSHRAMVGSVERLYLEAFISTASARRLWEENLHGRSSGDGSVRHGQPR